MDIEQYNPILSIEYKVNFSNGNGKQKARKPPAKPKNITRKIPRISKLLALAHHLQDLIEKGIIRDYADIARLAGLSRARVTQILNLTLLAPQIQEEIIFAAAIKPGPDYMKEHTLRMILKTSLWEEQLKIWGKLKAS
jgi:hypothetical protein